MIMPEYLYLSRLYEIIADTEMTNKVLAGVRKRPIKIVTMDAFHTQQLNLRR
jgi:hypothetical protein